MLDPMKKVTLLLSPFALMSAARAPISSSVIIGKRRRSMDLEFVAPAHHLPLRKWKSKPR